MKAIIISALSLAIIVVVSGCVNTTKNICTDEEKQAEICTLEYDPVCGFKTDGTSETYGNKCGACSDQVDYWEPGECAGSINSFDECIAAGYPAMESYPRQCSTGEKTFTEESCSYGEYVLTLNDAKQIASESECGSNFKETSVCNENTGTYWIDLDIEQEGCNPACVIDLETRTAEINWRCTGLIE